MSTLYNTLLFFDREGRLLGRHRKLMPTFTERLFWGQGDASDLRVFETDIGRIGGLICGEHLMTLVRAAMIGLGEDIHVAVFPGAFALHTGPELEEWDPGHQAFWGHASVRAHALEAGAFVVSACGYIDDADVPDDFPHKIRMNIRYARGGGSVIAPLGVPLAGPAEGSMILYADLQAWMIKAWKAIVDTAGHYARPDILRLSVGGHPPAGLPMAALEALPPRSLGEAAERHGVQPQRVEAVVQQALQPSPNPPLTIQAPSEASMP